jgi:hypothetical protein
MAWRPFGVLIFRNPLENWALPWSHRSDGPRGARNQCQNLGSASERGWYNDAAG